MKAIGTGWHRGVRWKDFEVTNLPSGRPTLRLHGEAKVIAEQIGVKAISSSLTHPPRRAWRLWCSRDSSRQHELPAGPTESASQSKRALRMRRRVQKLVHADRAFLDLDRTIAWEIPRAGVAPLIHSKVSEAAAVPVLAITTREIPKRWRNSSLTEDAGSLPPRMTVV